MNCPKCRSEIHEMKIEGVDLDFCSGCKGIWFDKDEMAFMVELHVDMPELEKVKKNAKKTDYDCPRCGSKLEEMKFSKPKDLLVDRCPQCHGIWLDKLELPKVEAIAATIGDPKSKIMLASKQFHDRGYQILGVKYR